MAIYGGVPVLFWTGRLWTSETVSGPWELVEGSSPLVWTNAETVRFWRVDHE